MIDALQDFISIVPFNKIEKTFYSILSVPRDCSMSQFINIFGWKMGLKILQKHDQHVQLGNGKNFDSCSIEVIGNFQKNSLQYIESHFRSCIGSNNLKDVHRYYSMYDSFEEYITRRYGIPKTTVRDILKNQKVSVLQSETESLDFRRSLIYSFKYQSVWENDNFKIAMEMNPGLQILVYYDWDESIKTHSAQKNQFYTLKDNGKYKIVFYAHENNDITIMEYHDNGFAGNTIKESQFDKLELMLRKIIPSPNINVFEESAKMYYNGSSGKIQPLFLLLLSLYQKHETVHLNSLLEDGGIVASYTIS
jgi:hypothetical protein